MTVNNDPHGFNRDSNAGREWRNCHGEVGHLVRSLRWRTRRAVIRRSVLLGCFALVSIWSGLFYPDVAAQIENRVTGSPCAHYTDEMRDYYCDKRRADLEPKLWEHISGCAECRREMGFYSGISETAVAAKFHSHQGAHNHPKRQPVSTIEDLLESATLATRP